MDAFDYPLPDAAIAQRPAEPRDSARLLDATGAQVVHRHVRDLADLVGPGDLLVVNETRVLPARLHARRSSGGAVEILLLEQDQTRPSQWQALVRPSRKLAVGERVEVGDGLVVEVGERLDGGRRAVGLLGADGGPPHDEAEVLDLLERHGEVPLPPYITVGLDDPERYQTVFARLPGSVAAPTAGLHLTPDLLGRCRDAGAAVATVELVVGLDTFRPVTVDDPADHVMHSEAYRVPPETQTAVEAARRVIAVGTTTVRALESAAHRGEPAGRTDLFIRSGFEFRAVDVLLTNFHMPRSSLLLLVDAFAGARWRDLYDTALAGGYRFLSFGDAMLLSHRAEAS